MSWKERDCHDQEKTDSKNKENVTDGVGGLTNLIWGTKNHLGLARDLTRHVKCIRKKICFETTNLIAN